MKLRLDSWPMLAGGAILVFVVSCLAASDPKSGGSSGSASSDTSTWTDSMTAHSALSSSVSSGTADTTYSPYYTPFPFTSILNDSYTLPTLTAVTSVTSRSRYLLSRAAGHYLTIGVPNSSDPIEATSFFNVTGSPASYSEILSETFQAVGDTAVTGGFRLDSELHGLYSVDINSDGSLLVFHNNRGTATSPASRGYLVFTYDSSTHRLQAKARYSYDLTNYTYSVDSSFTKADYYVTVHSEGASLVENSASATAITLYNAPINVDIPANFNPDSIDYQPNDRVAIKDYLGNLTTDMEGSGGHVRQNLSTDYTAQVLALGDDSDTATAASTELDAIEDTLSDEGAALRYPKNVYLAFRKGLLNTYLKSDDIANGTLGMHAVPYVFFTNAADDEGVHHPFMVIAAYSVTDKPNRLTDVRRPPGDGSTGGYADQKVTRDATLQLYLYKIPLKDYGTVSAVTDNTLPATLKSEAVSLGADSVYNHVSISGVGVAVDGTAIYPVMNNTLVPAQNNAELTSIGDHVGQGMGLHYHADGHIAMNNDLQMYNINDYKGRSHPPLIGFGLDGVALYGVYESQYSSMDGASTPLDAFGGHSHGDYGYHYHAHMVTAGSSSGNSYSLNVLLKGAWKGKINDIPEFWDTDRNEPSYALSQSNRYVGKAY